MWDSRKQEINSVIIEAITKLLRLSGSSVIEYIENLEEWKKIVQEKIDRARDILERKQTDTLKWVNVKSNDQIDSGPKFETKSPKVEIGEK